MRASRPRLRRGCGHPLARIATALGVGLGILGPVPAGGMLGVTALPAAALPAVPAQEPPAPTGTTPAGPGGPATDPAHDPGGPGAAGTGMAPTILVEDQVGWMADGDGFTARVRLARTPPASTLRVVAHEALRSREAFRGSLEGDLGDVEFEGRESPVPATAVTEVGFGADADLDQGVHPVDIQVLDAGDQVVANVVTYVVVELSNSEGLVPLAVSVVLDIAAPTALQPDGSVTLPPDALDRIDERVTVAEDAPARVPLTLAPRPETVDALATTDDAGQDLLARLAEASDHRSVLARPYTDIDVAALQQANLIGQVNAHAEGGADVIRSRLGTEPLPGIWPLSGTIGEAAAPVLNDLGVRQALVDREALASAPGLGEGSVPEEPVRLGKDGPEVMVNDEVLAARLTGTDPVLDAQRFVAELAMTWLEAPAIPRGVVVRVPASTELDPELVTRALAGLAEGPGGVDVVTLPQLFEVVRPPDGEARPRAELAGHQVTADLRGLAGRLLNASSQVAGLAGLVGDDEVGLSLTHSLLLATGADTPRDRRDAYIGRVTTELSRLSDVVDAQDEFRITLTSRSASIPINLTNTSEQPVDVRVELQSDQLEFPDGDQVLVTLEPGATRLDVRVRVLSSGAFPLDIKVTSPNGAVELDTTTFDIRSTVVSGVGLVLSVGAGLFLAVWWARNWRAGRRARGPAPPEDASRPPADGPSGDPADGSEPGGTAGGPTTGAPPQEAMTPRAAADAPTTGPAPGGPGPVPGAMPGTGTGVGTGSAPGAHRSTRSAGSGGPDGGDDNYRPAHMAGNRRHR